MTTFGHGVILLLTVKNTHNKTFKSDSATRASFASLKIWHALRHALTWRYTSFVLFYSNGEIISFRGSFKKWNTSFVAHKFKNT